MHRWPRNPAFHSFNPKRLMSSQKCWRSHQIGWTRCRCSDFVSGMTLVAARRDSSSWKPHCKACRDQLRGASVLLSCLGKGIRHLRSIIRRLSTGGSIRESGCFSICACNCSIRTGRTPHDECEILTQTIIFPAIFPSDCYTWQVNNRKGQPIRQD